MGSERILASGGGVSPLILPIVIRDAEHQGAYAPRSPSKNSKDDVMADGKWIAGLTPKMPVAEAAKIVLAERFAVVRQFLPLAAGRAWEDAEFVHQLRVGARRAGAALRVFADALPGKPLKATKRALRAVRQAAGDARDWDVFLAALPDAKPFAGATAKPALDFLLGYAFGQRAAAQARLITAEVNSGLEFRERSEALLERTRAPEGDDPPANFGALAGRQLGVLLRELTQEAEANPTEPAALHALRITAKRLRYAIELFADCFPPLVKESIYPAVESVQELLGEVQDATVSMSSLVDIRARGAAVMPQQLARVKKGIDSYSAALRKKVPLGAKAFAKWRKEWLVQMTSLKLDALS